MLCLFGLDSFVFDCFARGNIVDLARVSRQLDVLVGGHPSRTVMS
jgi:hypothetical protein